MAAEQAGALKGIRARESTCKVAKRQAASVQATFGGHPVSARVAAEPLQRRRYTHSAAALAFVPESCLLLCGGVAALLY